MKVEIQANLIDVFDSFYDWVNRASRAIGNIDTDWYTVICVDKDGYQCAIGEQFHQARENNKFPVSVYVLIKNTDKNIEP